MKKNAARITVLLALLAVTLVLSVAAPRAIEAGARNEYKLVRLVDDGAMPSITDALNREAERGWKLDEMTVTPGEPGTIYLVFVR